MILLVAALMAAAPQGPAAELSEERARQILPRADLTGLNGLQRAQFLEIAGDTFDYAGCNDTLARCLGATIKDRHALHGAARQRLSPRGIYPQRHHRDDRALLLQLHQAAEA